MPTQPPGPETSNGQASYLSPLMAVQPETTRPTCVCASCPAAIWYEDDALRCFCSIMKMMAYEPHREPIKNCDGRTSALAKLATAQATI